MSTQPKQPLTPQEYLEIERKAEYKNEYYNGEMFAMAGASRQHVRLTRELILSLGSQLRGGPCELFTGDMRVRVAGAPVYCYPDISIVCGEPRFEDHELDTLLNPVFLGKVLSPSTEAYDRGLKFENYRHIESLRQYMLVSQDRMQVDLFTKGDDVRWFLTAFSGRDAVVELGSIGCRIPLAALYQNSDVSSAT
jgi:Uma2 family endonuclease